jgi:signal transduction histidine kinase
MTLRNRLLALSLLTLLLPWSGWKLLQELEHFLREAQENALLSTARTLAGALPFEAQSRLQFAPGRYAVLRALERAPDLDGYADDWPDPEQALEWTAGGQAPRIRLLAGRADRGAYLLIDVAEASPAAAPGRARGFDLLVRSPRGLQRFEIHPEAPGPLQLHSEGGAGQAEGHWLDTSGGYRVELVLPVPGPDTDIRLEGAWAAGQRGAEYGWIALMPRWDEVSRSLAAAAPAAGRAWLVDRGGWILADSGPAATPAPLRTTWLQRLLYRVVAGGRTAIEPEPAEDVARLQGVAVEGALAGVASASWSQDPDSAVVSNTVAVPVRIEGRELGAVVLKSTSDSLLLVTNRALGRLLLTTLIITFGLAGGLWWFATRLSQRVRRLGGAVSAAMERGIGTDVLPLRADRDELGELARNNERLLRAVADYNQYLQTLAGKLSHELKTPLAITRSSLENLSSRPLDDEARQFLERAQEGLERQAAIVRAMSEASRLEAAIRVAEWGSTDLGALLRHCAAGYRDVHPGRSIEAEVPEQPVVVHCAPELLTQALDKLVDNAVSLSETADRVVLSLAVSAGECRIAVRNTGTRLPRELQDRLFDSLVSLREKRGATPHLGLGLYIVRLVAAAHGGQVGARNLPGGAGVEFELRFPAQPRAEE